MRRFESVGRLLIEVRMFPNSSRPNVGLKPRREGQRPNLPQHSRHCPVLEAGSSLGYLIFPPLEPHEQFHVEYQGEGQYRLVYYVSPLKKQWEPVFSYTLSFPAGGIGRLKEEIAFSMKKPPITRDAAVEMARTYINPEDTGTPQGDRAPRFDELPDAARLRHRLCSDLQHDRQAGCTDAGGSGGNGLVPA